MRRAAFIVCLAGVCLAAAAGVARADSSTTIADGVQIGVVSVGGLTAEEATTAVQAAYSAPVVVRLAHQSYPVAPSHFHTVLPVSAAVQTALTAAADTIVPFTPTLDPSLVKKWVATLATKTNRTPVAGAIVLRRNRPVLTHAENGQTLRQLPTQMLIRDEIRSGDRTTIVAPVRVTNATAVKSGPIIVIHRGINRLYLYDGTRYLRSFPVATGQAIYPTPLGQFQIVVKEKNPWWYPPTQDAWAKGLKPVPPGPGNPLGTRWMGLSAPGVGIHGTDEPWSIGHSESHGCIRMQVPSAEWLYNHVRVGTPVFIVAA